MGKTSICSIPFHCHSELHSMQKTSEDSLKKVFFFPTFKLLNSGCGLSAGAAYLRVFTVFIFARLNGDKMPII